MNVLFPCYLTLRGAEMDISTVDKSAQQLHPIGSTFQNEHMPMVGAVAELTLIIHALRVVLFHGVNAQKST